MLDEKVLNRILEHCLDDRSIENYTTLAGKKATKTDTKAVAQEVIPMLLEQLDSKASKDTRTADKLHEQMMQSFDPKACEDPKFGQSILSTLLGTRKAEVIGSNADRLLVHPFVIENMLTAMAPAVLRAYGNEFGRDIFHRAFGGPAPGPAAGKAPSGKEPARGGRGAEPPKAPDMGRGSRQEKGPGMSGRRPF